MSYFRSYFEKNNTIIKNGRVNTAKSPTTEIFYGSGFSKFIFKVDLDPLKQRIIDGEYVITDDTTHKLNLYNTILGNNGVLGQIRGTEKERTTSFDLILFKIPEFWDEGVGFDYDDLGYDFTTGNQTFSGRPSTWFDRTSLETWTTEGIYDISPEIMKTIHFDNGNENINVDITEFVNNILNGEVNYGFGLSFSLPYENIKTDIDRSVAFFTKYTQTFFEPFIESNFDDIISDNRQNFVGGTLQNLYLYVTKGKNPYDLDNLPIVDVLNGQKTQIISLSNVSTIKVKKGVYKVSVNVDTELCDGKRFLYDVWKNISIDGIILPNITQKFLGSNISANYNVGGYESETNRYVSQFQGIHQNEQIKRGEKRKIVVKFKSINYPKSQILDESYYRLFIREGRTQINVFDWTKLDVTTENLFILDTSFLIPREYYIEIKGKTHGEEIFHPELIKFEIVSEK